MQTLKIHFKVNKVHSKKDKLYKQVSNSPVKQYLFGYGSLINSHSRKKTLVQHTQAIPVVIQGLQRSWSYKCQINGYTAVCVDKSPLHSCNGVLIHLSDPHTYLSLLDHREKDYKRTLIHPSQVKPWKSKSQHSLKPFNLSNAIIWVYENDPSIQETQHTPSMDCPIPQSYVDCVISGCLKFGTEFAKQFISTTNGWSSESFYKDRNLEFRKYKGDELYFHEARIVDDLMKDLNTI